MRRIFTYHKPWCVKPIFIVSSRVLCRQWHRAVLSRGSGQRRTAAGRLRRLTKIIPAPRSTPVRRIRVHRPFMTFVAFVLAVAALTVVQAQQALRAEAATQNGYVFNNTWTLTDQGAGSGKYTDPNQYQPTALHATSSIPLATGAVDLSASFTPGSNQLSGTN